MAIINGLSLSSDGGIVSSASQCEQVENTVSIFIGLGGTGIDAIRSIKTQVYERLIPDNAEAYNDPNSDASIPEYRHIKFLSIDCDRSSNKGFDDDEIFSLNLPNLPEQSEIEEREDLKWVPSYAFRPNPYFQEPAGGVRQAGRFLLFDKMVDLESKIDTLINQAKKGLLGNIKVVVHVFAGISGGTGSGTFLDVCYLIRKVLENYANRSILGYFFMPDVSLSKKGIDNGTKEFIKKNGYAALQELNYCMNIPNNGGAFRQVIKDGSYIYWDRPPVDMCYLIGAKDRNRVTAYYQAINTVTDYIIGALSDSYDDYFMLSSIGDCQYARNSKHTLRRTGGYNPCMISLGAASARIPYKEINTYLACSIFEEYRKTHEESVDRFAAEEVIRKAWNVTSNPAAETLVEKIYYSLLQKLSGNDIDGLQGYDYYQDPDGSRKPWNYLLETVQSNDDNNLEAVYQSALEDHIGILAANAAKLINQGVEGAVNIGSLLYQLDKQLDPIVKDITKGPQYAKNIIDNVEGINVLSLIVGLKDMNNIKNEIAQWERAARYHDYQETKRIFFNRERQGLLNGDKDRFFDFENCVIAYVHSIELAGGKYSNDPDAKEFKGVYGYISDVLDALEEQIRDRVANYYSPLCSTLVDLTDTFRQNYEILTNGLYANMDDDLDSLVSIHDPRLISVLEEQTKKINKGDKFRELMTSLIEAGYEVWQKRDERLPKTIQHFFVAPPNVDKNEQGGLFYAYAEKSIDEFLEIKYNGLKGKALEDKLAEDSFGKLIDGSAPLLVVDITKYDNQKCCKNILLFPDDSAVISSALKKDDSVIDREWIRCPSSIRDRLLFVQIIDGFPLQAYVELQALENKYYNISLGGGNHLFESDGIYDDMVFSDWRNLPTITVPSFMDDNTSDQIKVRVDHVRELFDKAVECGVIKINSPYNELNEASDSYIYGVPDVLQEEIDGLTETVDMASPSELNQLKVRVSELLAGGYKELERTDLRLKQPGGRCNEDYYDERLKFDFFYLAPVYQIKVRAIIDKLEENYKTLQRISDILGGKS